MNERDLRLSQAPRLRDGRGRLTAYAFACGYCEREERNGVRFSLWQEHGVYHVQRFDGVRTWETARTLTAARKILAALKRPIALASAERA